MHPLPKLPPSPLTQARLWLLSCLYGFHRSEIEQMTGWTSDDIEGGIETSGFNDRHSEPCKHAARQLRKHVSERYELPLDEVWRTPVPTLRARLREALLTNAESRELSWEDLGTANLVDATMLL